MFWAHPRPSSGAYNCINSFWFYRWSVGGNSTFGRGLAGLRTGQTTTNSIATTNVPTVKPEAVNAVVSS